MQHNFYNFGYLYNKLCFCLFNIANFYQLVLAEE